MKYDYSKYPEGFTEYEKYLIARHKRNQMLLSKILKKYPYNKIQDDNKDIIHDFVLCVDIFPDDKLLDGYKVKIIDSFYCGHAMSKRISIAKVITPDKKIYFIAVDVSAEKGKTWGYV